MIQMIDNSTDEAPTGPVDGSIAFQYTETDGSRVWVQVSGRAAMMKRQNPRLDHGMFVRMLESDKSIRQGKIHLVRTFY